MVAIGLAIGARTIGAQAFVMLDGGYARVTYDGFLPVNAATGSLGFRLEDALASVSARGTMLRFETGNTNVSGLVSGNAFTRPYHDFRGEAIGTVGASTYKELAHYGYVLGRTRIHYSRAQRGTWLDGAVGQNYFFGTRKTITQFGSGVWLRHDLGTLSLSALRTAAGDTSFTDGEAALRLMQRRVDLDLTVGTRAFSVGAGRGVYGEASGTMWLRGELGLVLSGGRYPSDPVRGSISGRYASMSLRYGSRGSASERGFPREISPRRPPPTGFSMPLITDLEMRRATNGWRTFRLHAAGATHVEMMGDFTEWQPVAMGRAGEDIWEVTLPLLPGVHRFNVRADGGSWTVPLGYAVQSDDFGGTTGILLIQ